jgi:hypothetical protein
MLKGKVGTIGGITSGQCGSFFNKGDNRVLRSLIIGGSNAKNLAYAASSLGVETYQLVKGGWKVSK